MLKGFHEKKPEMNERHMDTIACRHNIMKKRKHGRRFVGDFQRQPIGRCSIVHLFDLSVSLMCIFISRS